MDFEVKNQKILEKIRFKSNVFFDCIFLWILGGFGESLGRVLGGVWEAFRRDLGHFGRILQGLGAFWALWSFFLGFACIFEHFMHFYIFLTSQAKPSHVSHFLA